VQNNLVYAGLARFLDDQGQEVRPVNWMGLKNILERCEITAAGRSALAEHLKLPPSKPRHCKVALQGCFGRGARCDCGCHRCWNTPEAKARRAKKKWKRAS
jgi:hypothetical protein